MEQYGKRIRVFKNGDGYFTGKKMLISPIYYRIYEQFLRECSKELGLKVKSIYTIDGTKVKELEDFADGSCYVCTSGEPFKKIQYNDSETGPNFNAYSKMNINLIPVVNDNPILERRKINKSNGGLLSEIAVVKGSEESLFAPTTKAFKIAVFENGEPKQDGIRLILNHRNCKTFDQLMKYFSSLKLIKSGQVRKLYDAKTGKRIRHLSGIENGMNIALSSFDPFKKLPYRFIDLSAAASNIKREPEVLRIVKFFPNGDAYHSGLTVTVTKRRHSTLTKLLDHLNAQIELVTGKIQKIYSIDGIRCNTIEEIKGSGNYVLVANDDPFIKTQYNKMSLKSGTSRTRGLQGHTLRNDFIKRIRPITQRRFRRDTSNQDNIDAGEDSSIEAPPTRLKTSKKSKQELLKTNEELEGHEAETEDVPVSRKLASRGKTPVKPKTPSIKQKELLDNSTIQPQEASLYDEKEKTTEKEPVLVDEKKSVPLNSAKKPKNDLSLLEKKSKPDMSLLEKKSMNNVSQNEDRPDIVKLLKKSAGASRSGASTNKSKPASPAAVATADEDVPEDEQIAKSSGREEEELFESEKQNVKILSATKSHDGLSQARSSSKPGSRVHTAPNNNDMIMNEEDLIDSKIIAKSSNQVPASPAPPKKYTSTSNTLSNPNNTRAAPFKSSKSISKIPKSIASRSSSQANIKSEESEVNPALEV